VTTTRTLLALLVPLVISSPALAIEPFGFQFGASQQAVEKAITDRGIGAPSWLGKTLRVQATSGQFYMFNFCQGQLVEVTGMFPPNFDQMANIVDSSITSYGQPVLVSAVAGMADAGPLRPINIYWKVDEKTFLRLMELPQSYSLVYETRNSCWKVPR
jgi:hypothetical protein